MNKEETKRCERMNKGWGSTTKLADEIMRKEEGEEINNGEKK